MWNAKSRANHLDSNCYRSGWLGYADTEEIEELRERVKRLEDVVKKLANNDAYNWLTTTQGRGYLNAIISTQNAIAARTIQVFKLPLHRIVDEVTRSLYKNREQHTVAEIARSDKIAQQIPNFWIFFKRLYQSVRP